MNLNIKIENVAKTVGFKKNMAYQIPTFPQTPGAEEGR